MTIPTSIIGTTLKHLNVKKANYFRSLEMDPSSSDSDHYNAEIDKLNEAINFFEEVREASRVA
jgi:hypothetical protein